jgi:FSR family fosmidomycin resistance protein-like MFS transporter
MVASEASQSARTKATGVFFAAGQTGLFIGPILTGFLLDIADRPGTVILPILALSALISGWRWLSIEPTTIRNRSQKPDSVPSAATHPSKRTVLSLSIILISSTAIGITTMTFAPKLFTDLEYPDTYVGWATGLYMIGSAIGGIVGGTLADRFGKRLPIVLGMFGAILPIYFYIPVGDPWRFVLLPLAGFFAGMPLSVLIIFAQSLLPGRRAFASGVILGLMFFSGAVISMFVGFIADQIGLGLALQWLVVLPLVAIVGTLLLPDINNQKTENL